MKFDFNQNTAMKIFILVLFLILLIVLALSGDIKYYIHPKMYIFLALATVFLALMIWSQFLLQPETGKLKSVYLFLLLPVAFGLLYPPDSLEATISKNRGISLENNTIPGNGSKTDPNKSGENNTGPPTANTIVITPENFIEVLDLIYREADSYMGKKIKISGFVYLPDKLEHNRFVLARLFMSCCAADAGMIGILCQWEKHEEYKQDHWYEITGTLITGKYKGKSIPLISISKGNSIEKPDDIYIYF